MRKMQEKYRTAVKKKALGVVAVCAVIIFVLVLSRWSDGRSTAELSTQEGRLAYLSELGLNADAASEEYHSVKLPEKLTDVLEKYNELQRSQGFDLSEYCGQSCDQYTYELTDYKDSSEKTYVTLYILNGAVIGGDVHSAELGGFMCALKD